MAVKVVIFDLGDGNSGELRGAAQVGMFRWIHFPLHSYFLATTFASPRMFPKAPLTFLPLLFFRP